MAKNKFYLTVATSGDRVLVREMVDGKVVNRVEEWQPTLYMKCKPEDSDIKSLYGHSAKTIVFDSISDAKDTISQYKDVQGIEIFGQQNWVLQYLYHYKQGTPVFADIPVRGIDIETRVPESGFPVPAKAEAEIVLITCMDRGKRPITFGTKPYSGKDTDFRYFSSESEMLSSFIAWWEQEYPVVVTGWNTEGFDFPYLCNRIQNVLGTKAMNRLSPWGKVTITESRVDPDVLDVRIQGIEHLDYMSLMKKFTYGGRPSWSLGSVAQEELGHTKVDHSEFKNFNDFIDNGWVKFVKYNVIDVDLVMKLDAKMKLIDLAFTMAYKARINFQDVYSPVKTWDAILHNALLDKGIVVPQRAGGRPTRVIDGGYVKTPVPGFYEYVTSIDATSLYPSIMMLLNLSPETYCGMTDSSVPLLLNGHTFEDKKYAHGANGAMFKKDVLGIIPELIKSFMKDRKAAKSKMLGFQAEYEKTKDDSLLSLIAALDNEQMAIKIAMNALYGAMSNEGFRFFNQDVAEAITTTGQLFLRTIDQRLSDMIVKKFGVPKKDYVPYQDTDSVYLHVEEIMKKYVPEDTPIDKKIKVLEQITSKHIQPMVNQICDAVSDVLNVYERTISFKLEIAADKAIFVAKKKYAARVYSSEGVTYDKPKLKVMGLEMVRSSTPMFVRDKLKDTMELIFETDEKTVQKYIEKVKNEFLSLDPEDIARPTGIKGIAEREAGLNESAATPIHVRAAMLYNKGIKDRKLQSQYHLIKEGEKIKYVYLKMPNPIKQNVVAWPVDDKLPEEFGLHKYVDYETQFQKTFLSATKIILDAIKWSPEHVDSLDDFFS